MPVLILEAFKFVDEAPEPEKVEPEKYVADIGVPVPVQGRNNDSVEDIYWSSIPSLQFIFCDCVYYLILHNNAASFYNYKLD